MFKQPNAGIISHIQRFSIHDGPGVRTSVFFKGCPLSCLWCHNPETIRFGTELSYNDAKCIRCGICARCPNGAIITGINGGPEYSPSACVRCDKCAEDCPTGAIFVRGRILEPEALLTEIMADEAFYAKGGGVTLTGGEPTAQPEFCRKTLELLQDRGVHTALDTSGQCAEHIFKSICEYANLVLFDLKHMDARKHEEFCGVGNKLILRNLSYLLTSGIPLEIRIPLVGGVNDDDTNIVEIARFLTGAKNVTRLILLKHHKLGLSKPVGFGGRRGMRDASAPSDGRIYEILRIFGNMLPDTFILVR